MPGGEIEMMRAVWSFVVRRSVMRVTEMVVMMSVRSEDSRIRCLLEPWRLAKS